MNRSKVNRQIISFLKSIADKDTFYMRKKSGHPICVAEYGGQKRIFTLSTTPCERYEKHMKPQVNRFLKTLPIQNPPIFKFK